MKQALLIVFLFIIAGTVFAQEGAKSLAVATFDITGNAVTKDEANSITELFIVEMASTGKVKIVDRSNFEKILTKMNFQSSDWSDNKKTAQLGTSINADIIARGQIIKLGSKLYLSATIIDLKTATVLSSVKVEFSQIEDIFGLLTDFCAELIESLKDSFKIDLGGGIVFNIDTDALLEGTTTLANNLIGGLTVVGESIEKAIAPETYKIGDTGQGDGMVFFVESNTYLECSRNLANVNWEDAVTLVKNYRGGGYDDWYLPSKDELNYIYENLRKVDFIADDGVLWSSSEDNFSSAWNQRFSDGHQSYYYTNKSNNWGVRAVRAFTP